MHILEDKDTDRSFKKTYICIKLTFKIIDIHEQFPYAYCKRFYKGFLGQ